MCLEIYKIDPACFVTASGLAWKSALEKNKVKLDLLTGTDMQKKGTRAETCHVIHRYAKANN